MTKTTTATQWHPTQGSLQEVSAVSSCDTLILKMVNCCILCRFCKVGQEGATEHFFNENIQYDPEGWGVAAVVGEEALVEVPEIVKNDASNFRAQGFSVDDDNEPASENITCEEDNIEDCQYFDWGAVTFDERMKPSVKDVNLSLVDVNAHMHLGYSIHFPRYNSSKQL